MGQYARTGALIGQQLGKAWITEADAKHRKGAVADVLEAFEAAGLDVDDMQEAIDNPEKLLDLMSDPEFRGQVQDEAGKMGIEGDLAGDLPKGVVATGEGNEMWDMVDEEQAGEFVEQDSYVDKLISGPEQVKMDSNERRKVMNNVYYKAMSKLYSDPRGPNPEALKLLENLDKRFNPDPSEDKMSPKALAEFKFEKEKELITARGQQASQKEAVRHKNQLEEWKMRSEYDNRALMNSTRNARESKLILRPLLKLETEADARAKGTGPDAYNDIIEFMDNEVTRIKEKVVTDRANIESGNIFGKEVIKGINENIKEMEDDIRDYEERAARIRFKKMMARKSPGKGGGGSEAQAEKMEKISKLEAKLARTTNIVERAQIEKWLEELKK